MRVFPEFVQIYLFRQAERFHLLVTHWILLNLCQNLDVALNILRFYGFADLFAKVLMAEQTNFGIECCWIKEWLLLNRGRLPHSQSIFQNDQQNFLLVYCTLMLVKVARHHFTTSSPYFKCLPFRIIFRYRYQMLRLKIIRLLLFGQFFASRDEHRLQNAIYQSIFSPSTECQQHVFTFQRCSLIGMQDVIVQMLYFEFQRNQDSSLSLEFIIIQHLFSTDVIAYKSSLLPYQLFHSVILAKKVKKSKQDLRILTTETKSFTLNMFFSILGSNSFINIILMDFTKSNLPQDRNSFISSPMSVCQAVRIDSQSQGMLVAQFRLFIIGFRLIFKF